MWVAAPQGGAFRLGAAPVGRWSCPGLRPVLFVPSEPALAGSELRHSAPGGSVPAWGGPAPEHQHSHASQPAVRLGLRMVGGLSRAVGERISAARAVAPFASTQDLSLRCQLDVGDLRALASADALQSLSGHRRQQVWDASALRPAPALLQGVPIEEEALLLEAAEEGEEVVFDYASVGLSLRSHPLALLRAQLAPRRLLTAAQMRDFPSGRLVRACGIVTMRQQPGTAKGVVFVTLEDETGSVNVIVWKAVKEQFREVLYRARLMAVFGIWQKDAGGEVRHVVAKRLVDLTHLLGNLNTVSRDFH